MAFRLPGNLQIGQEYTAVSPSDVSALEEALPANRLTPAEEGE